MLWVSPVEVTAPLQRRAWQEGVLPPVEALGDGLWSIPVPLPDNPLRYVLVYALEAGSQLVLVDAGWNTEAAWQALSSGIAEAGFAVSDITGVLVTHIHPDHYGLAGRVREATGAWVALHPDDAALIPGRYGADVQSVIALMRRQLLQHGVPEESVVELSDASMGLLDFVHAVEPDRLIEDGARIDLPGWELRAIHTPGHSPGHVCFHDASRRLLFSGDHVLPRISPSITVHPQAPDNPLADFLSSLQRVGDLDVTEVLPAHEWRFRPLRERVRELEQHHRDRLDEVLRVVAELVHPTAWDIAQQLHWSRPWDSINGFMRRSAVGETLAHLTLLQRRGLLLMATTEPVRWSLPEAAPA